ncbi:hypothetical protein VP01_11257g1 [Puccinia sorghi]|uniref:Uncharacterized protein n=1 Tax=Puccinia sorghi TaxID=27349 RepID=A0A0L6VSI3_9BASI|nr:hypothetical protein VP01_11257g1 [Puccinia sorghi]
MYNLGWQKGYEEASKICITGIAAKIAKYPNRYCKAPKPFKKQHNALKAPELEPSFKEDPGHQSLENEMPNNTSKGKIRASNYQNINPKSRATPKEASNPFKSDY